MISTVAYLRPEYFLIVTSQTVTVLAILLAFLLFISFCTSGADVAFFSLTYKEINLLKTKQQPGFRRIVKLLEAPKVLLATLRLSNIIANIGIVFLANFLLDEYLPIQPEWAMMLPKVLIISCVILLFAEVLPKTLAAQNNVRFASDVSFVVEGVYLLFNQIARLLVNLGETIEKKLGRNLAQSSMQELNQAIELSTADGASEGEKDILKGILKFGNITVKQVMRSRLDVHGLSYEDDFLVILKQVTDLNYSRLPIYSNSLDDIKGILHTKDLLPYQLESKEFDWHTLMRPAQFVHEHMMIEDLMQEMQAKRIHFAVVVDEFGGTSGIITLEDILEEVIGEIKDEFDEEETINARIDDLNYVFEGKTLLNDVCKIMGIPPDTFDDVKGESDSLAGLILEKAGEIPKQNDVITIGHYGFTIIEVEKNRIQKVRVSILP